MDECACTWVFKFPGNLNTPVHMITVFIQEVVNSSQAVMQMITTSGL